MIAHVFLFFAGAALTFPQWRHWFIAPLFAVTDEISGKLFFLCF